MTALPTAAAVELHGLHVRVGNSLAKQFTASVRTVCARLDAAEGECVELVAAISDFPAGRKIAALEPRLAAIANLLRFCNAVTGGARRLECPTLRAHVAERRATVAKLITTIRSAAASSTGRGVAAGNLSMLTPIGMDSPPRTRDALPSRSCRPTSPPLLGRAAGGIRSCAAKQENRRNQ